MLPKRQEEPLGFNRIGQDAQKSQFPSAAQSFIAPKGLGLVGRRKNLRSERAGSLSSHVLPVKPCDLPDSSVAGPFFRKYIDTLDVSSLSRAPLLRPSFWPRFIPHQIR